ncbi:hypothetical protein EDD21DRAFT_404690, partial [Dissophora ornata]
MLSSPFSPWRSVLTPQTALDLATSHLENARKAQSPELALAFCNDAETALARIKTSVRKAYVSSSRPQDRTLCNEIATTYSELGELLDSLGRRSKAQASYNNEEKWGGRAQLPGQSSSRSDNVNSLSDASLVVEPAAYLSVIHAVPPPPPRSLIQDSSSRDIATIPPHIFAKDMDQP